jgi:hypothetical protein
MQNNQNDVREISPFDPTLAWEYYTTLENEFLEFLKYVPLKKEHYKVWSPHLGNILNNTGSVIDSFLKTSLFSDIFDNIDDIDSYRKQIGDNKKLNMSIYRTVFEEKYRLSNKKIFDLKTYSSIIPFSEWERKKSPGWWVGYTNYKHDQFTHKNSATVKTTLDTLGGLFLLNVIHLETRTILYREKLIESIIPLYGESLLDVILEIEPFKSHRKIRLKSRLFGYVFETEKEMSDGEKVTILSPWIHNTYRNPSPRLKNE